MDDVPNGRECLPVVSARLNPACEFTYDDIDFQHAIAEHQWYVSGYGLNFKHPITEKLKKIFIKKIFTCRARCDLCFKGRFQGSDADFEVLRDRFSVLEVNFLRDFDFQGSEDLGFGKPDFKFQMRFSDIDFAKFDAKMIK